MLLELGCIILLIIIGTYILTVWYLWKFQNPTIQTSSPNSIQSVVTHSQIGNRGDMGNQFFQIATVIAAAKRSGAKAVFPTRLSTLPISELFDLPLILQDIQPDRIFREYDNYEAITIPADGKCYDIRGYRQAYRYFEAEDLESVFIPKADLLSKMTVPPEYIAVHIRRGDYLGGWNSLPLVRGFTELSIKYYQSAVAKLELFHPNIPILVCTDSPEYVKSILKDLHPRAELAPTYISPKFSDFLTLYLATAMVGSNSTYSWWAAYLRRQAGDSRNRSIIFPTPWWDPRRFVGSNMNLDGPYLYPTTNDGTCIWTLLDAQTGEECSLKPEQPNDTLSLFRMVRGFAS